MIIYEKNEARGEVKASICGCEDDVVNKVQKALGINGMSTTIIKAAKIKDKFTGKSICHASDEFNEDVGKMVAKSKLLEAYHTEERKALNRVHKLIEEQRRGVKKKIKKATRKQLKYTNKLE